MNKYVSGTFSGNGSSSSVPILKGGVIFVGSADEEDFGAGTVRVQCQGPDGVFYDSATTLTDSDVRNIEFLAPTVVRLTLAGSTNPILAYAIQSDSPELVQ